MSTPLGDFVRAKRDALAPEQVGLDGGTRRRAPGLRRSEVAVRAGVSVEYLTRIEQGRDRNPSIAVLGALAEALALDASTRGHLFYLAKITGGACAGRPRADPAPREVRSEVRATLALLEPGVAVVTNRLGDVLAHTTGFELVMAPTGLLDGDAPNLTRFVFCDPRARDVFTDWAQVADECAFELLLGPSLVRSESFRAELAPTAGPEFTRRVERPVPPKTAPLRIAHPDVGEMTWKRETLELAASDAQQLVVLLPDDEPTADALARLRHAPATLLRAV